MAFKVGHKQFYMDKRLDSDGKIIFYYYKGKREDVKDLITHLNCGIVYGEAPLKRMQRLASDHGWEIMLKD